ncbi:DUF58 domain-containing protein [Marinobacterium sp. AK62]|uniref:DUF58 domain-containing protein n=1 Tax=Marinobacterium alkalitolerans TaxID=1542925 RepID=A0ABS3ZCT1_9GAMM|nr:DUF58 domain-containing protein [Marinobacterium alkalitolerans]MBP0049508.1 DUF58 domain-containing protein [Marinobacterium alkalitolerans]
MSWASRPRFELMGRIRRWSLSRQSPETSIRLTQKRIYILPTASGTLFLVLLMLLLLMAINYENNLIYALTFLLGSLFLVTILHTYHNLAGIQLTAVRGNHCHAGETAYFQLRLDQQGVRDRIRLLLPGGSPVTVDLVEPIHWLELGCPALERGWLKPSWVRLETLYPLGLFRAWTWARLEMKALVYPAPLDSPLPEQSESTWEGIEQNEGRDGTEDFTGLERFRPGMSPRQIDWKSLARGRGLYAKQFTDYSSPDLWLDLHSMGGEPLERRLSRITGWVEQLSKEDRRYGLRLGATVLEPDRGEQHRYRVLKALALYGLEGTAE